MHSIYGENPGLPFRAAPASPIGIITGARKLESVLCLIFEFKRYGESDWQDSSLSLSLELEL